MIATISTVDQVQFQFQIPPEVLTLALDKEVSAQVLTWDSCGTCEYQPSEIIKLESKEDMLRFVLTNGRATVLSANQFLNYWELIQANKRELIDADQPTQEMIVEMAKTSGTAIWEQGTKLGYVAQYRKQFYAVGEVLVYAKGFQYSYSRHGSFQLACDALVEQSWVEEVA